MNDETGDDQLIYEAAILAGAICAGESLAAGSKEEARLILREMRAETECARLARRLTSHFRIPPAVSIGRFHDDMILECQIVPDEKPGL